jgi:hypothetical protein
MTTENQPLEQRGLTHVHSIPADTPVSRCRFYRATCGLPAVVIPETGRIVVRANLVGAITLPAPLAAAVKQHQQGAGAELGDARHINPDASRQR